MINQGDSTATVKTKIADALALVGVAAPTSWSDSHNKINNAASGMSLPTITDGLAGGTARARINAVIAGLETPANVTLPTVTGDAVQGETLTTTTGTWTGLAPITYAYQWFNSDADITGATASTYVLTEDDVGLTVGVRVTATNVRGPVGVESDVTAPVAGGGYDPVAELGSDLHEYWDADASETLSLAGASVVSWASQFGLTPTQAVSGDRATYETGTINGLNAVAADGVTDNLGVSGVGNLPVGANECEIWALVDQRTLASVLGTTAIFSYGNTGATGQARQLSRIGSGGNRARAVGGTGSANIIASGSEVDFSGICVVRAIFAVDGVSIEINGYVDAATAGTLGGTPTTRTRIAANASVTLSQFWAGAVNKILVTNRLTSQKADPLRAWLARLGGVSLYAPFDFTPDATEWETIPDVATFSYNGLNYNQHSAKLAHSIMESLNHPNFLRFQVNQGDEWAGDEGRVPPQDRAELRSTNGQMTVGEQTDFAFAVRALGVGADGVRNIFQIFNDNVEFQLQSTPQSLVFRTYHNDGSGIVSVVRHTAARLGDEVPENFVLRINPIPSGGVLACWRGGVELFNLSGIPIGSLANLKTFKFGAYRARQSTPFVIEYANFTKGTDLSAKIANPDAWPAFWS